ncbi:LLM class flavin-dependent oxidoreductase [Nocardia sp. NPDC050378]|uniref:LLM class flavin-dependent oxidoreductase n=1 Tax=Nocardia sp. NPDC050378 TaxID=3155400 RepID=UPI0033CC666D
MRNGFRHGVMILPEHSWKVAREQWVLAEEFGFDHAWMYDHLVWRWFREKAWYATVPTLAAVAASTTRLRFGTLVASPSIRHPVALVKDMMTLDDISGGRVVCGVGAGAAGGQDDAVVGQPELSRRESSARFTEFVELTDLLLRQPVTSYTGKYFSTTEVHLHPGSVQQPRIPLAVAATGPKGIHTAAKHGDVWVTTGWPGHGELARFDAAIPALREQAAQLDRACHEAGRAPKDVRRMLVTGAKVGGELESLGSYRDACGMLDEIGFTDLVSHWPRPDFPYEGSMSVLENIAGELLTPSESTQDS